MARYLQVAKKGNHKLYIEICRQHHGKNYAHDYIYIDISENKKNEGIILCLFSLQVIRKLSTSVILCKMYGV